MKASVRTSYGGPESIRFEDVPIPEPKDDEVLVRVYATTVSRSDCGILTGKPYAIRIFSGFSKPNIPITGTDFAGVVEKTGNRVSKFRAGDKVWGFNDNGCGSHAEFLTFPEKEALLPIPGDLRFDEAVACAEGAHYAYNFIDKVSLNPDMNVMVNGGTGAIGSAAIQLLKYHGLHVVATAPAGHIETVSRLGADRVIDYQLDDFTLDKERFDLVFDSVGKSSFARCKRIMKQNGIYISSELGPHNENPFLALVSPFTKGKRVKFPLPLNITRSMSFVSKLVEEGKFSPLIDKKFKLEQVAEAFSYVMSEKKIGNVILDTA